MAITQRQNFTALNQDTEPGFMAPGRYRYALNCHVGSSERGNIGSVETVKGNVLVSTELPGGTNKVIGTYEDIENNRVIYFLYNSGGQHGIYQFDILTTTITLLMEDPNFNFDPDYLITGIGLINGILSWCDDLNPNRLVDLNKVGTYSTPYVEEMISLIKRPNNLPPTFTRNQDLAYKRNYIYKKEFQFATRFIYEDNSKSAISPYSKLCVSNIVVQPEIFKHLNPAIHSIVTLQKPIPDSNNYIEVSLNINELLASNYVDMVKKIEVLVREENTGSFGVFKTLTRSQFVASQLVRFYNDESINIVDPAVVSQLFDSVPLKSKAHSLIKNRGFWGGNTEGYSIDTSIDIDIVPTYTDFFEVYTPQFQKVIPSLFGKKIFKDRGVFNIGIVWYDKYNRSCGVRDQKKISIDANSNTNRFLRICDSLRLTLDGTPPDWAYYYSVVRTKNLNQGFFQNIDIFEIRYLTGYNTDNTPIYTPGNTYSSANVNLEVHLSYSAGKYSNTPYVFTEGDRIFFYYKDFTIPAAPVYRTVDLELKGVFYGEANALYAPDGESSGVSKLIVENFDFGLFINNFGESEYFAEIYSTVKNDGVYYEIGETYPITDPGTPERALSQTSINLVGDVYFTTRTLSANFSITLSKYIPFRMPVESMGLFDDIFSVNNSDIGRPNLVIDEERQEFKGSGIRFGNQYIQGSYINGLSTFFGLNEKILPAEYGPIYKLQIASNTEADSNVLLSIHSHQIASLYIEEVVYSDIAGKNTIGVSNDVIGAVRALRGSYGCINPESVVQNNGSVYGWDMNKGVVWRYAADGLNAISNIENKNFFYEKSREMLDIPNVRVFSTFDRYFNEVILTLDDTTIAFNEASNVWTTYYSFAPEFFQKINTKIVSFKDGQLWLHDSNEVHNNFYGVQYTSKVSPVFNIEPDKSKVLLNISTESQDKWVGIEITNPAGQLSDLRDTDYTTNETGYSANVLRDRNTPNIVLPQIPLLHGDLMRDYSFTTLLECTSTDLSILRFVNFNVIPSERNN